jgi:hypothetical protein
LPRKAADILSGEQRNHRGERQIFVFRQTRHEIRLPAALRNGSEAQLATVTNLSPAGFQAVTQSPVPEGSEITITLQGALRPAVARWGQEDRAGFQFLDDLDPKVLASLVPKGIV